MKNIKRILIGLTALGLIFTSCEGPAGRDGFDGLDGLDGFDGIEASIFEIEDANFVSTNGETATINVTADNRIDIIQSDVALVYVLDPVKTAENNGLDVWEPLPSTFFFDDGGFAQFRYNFIFDEASNVFDIEITLESNDFNELEALFTDNQVFRIAVIPANNVNTFSAKAIDFLQVIDNSDVIKLN